MIIQPSKIVTLYRPATAQQLQAIARADWLAFGAESLISGYFYPMLHSSYARLLAREWNARQYGEGFVLQCRVHADGLSSFQPQTVATARHLEYCIPANKLHAFNAALCERIQVVQHYGIAAPAKRPTIPMLNATPLAAFQTSDWAFACSA
jgi:hypothetical protein